MREAHAHLLQLGRSLSMADLTDARSVPESLDLLANAAPIAGWVLGHALRVEGFEEPRWPSLDELDRLHPETPCCCWGFDYHSLVCNSPALAAAGLLDLPEIPGGRIELDPDGRPTGLLLERAALRLWDAVPEPAHDQRPGLLAHALTHLSKLGFTEVHDLKSQDWLGPTLVEMAGSGDLPMSVGLFPLVEDLGAVAAARTEWECDEVRLLGGKLFVDGTLNARTAWMIEPFADGHDAHPRGMSMVEPGEIEDAAVLCDRLGLVLACHAIGDMAVRAVLDAIETSGGGRPGHRVEHAEVIAESDIPRFAALGAVASVQPCHLLADIEALQRAIPDRLDRVLPLSELINAGCEPGRLDGAGVVFGSDVPIVRADPEDSLLGATERGRGDGVRIGADQAIPRETALACFGG